MCVMYKSLGAHSGLAHFRSLFDAYTHTPQNIVLSLTPLLPPAPFPPFSVPAMMQNVVRGWIQLTRVKRSKREWISRRWDCRVCCGM